MTPEQRQALRAHAEQVVGENPPPLGPRQHQVLLGAFGPALQAKTQAGRKTRKTAAKAA